MIFFVDYNLLYVHVDVYLKIDLKFEHVFELDIMTPNSFKENEQQIYTYVNTSCVQDE